MCLTRLSSHCVSYVFWQYRAVSCPSVCVAPAANPLPASAKMRTLLKQSSQLTFLALGAPSPKEQDLLSLSSKPDPSSSLWWQRSCVGPRPAMEPWAWVVRKGMWGNLFSFLLQNRDPCACLFLHVHLFTSSSVYRARQNERENTVTHKLITTNQDSTVITNNPDLMWRAMTRAYLHRVENSWSWAQRRTVRSGCPLQLAHIREITSINTACFPVECHLTLCDPVRDFKTQTSAANLFTSLLSWDLTTR